MEIFKNVNKAPTLSKIKSFFFSFWEIIQLKICKGQRTKQDNENQEKDE